MGSIIDGLAPDQFALLVSLFAVAISDGLTADEATTLGSFLAALGDTVVLIGAQMVLLESMKSKDGNSQGGG